MSGWERSCPMGFLALFLSCLVVATLSAPDLTFQQIQDMKRFPSDRFNTPRPPDQPCSYEAVYNRTVPYSATLQTKPFEYVVHLWVDCKTGSIRQDITANGTTTIISTQDTEFYVAPVLDNYTCLEDVNVSRRDNILRRPGKWTYMGDAYVQGKPATQWMVRVISEGISQYYRYFIDAETGAPLHYVDMGFARWKKGVIIPDFDTDESIAEFTFFKAGRPNSSVFERPEACLDAKAISGPKRPHLSWNVHGLMPGVFSGDPEYDRFVHKHGRVHTDPSDYRMRLETFNNNKELVSEWNKREDVTHTLELNRFADWTADEMQTYRKGRFNRRGFGGTNPHLQALKASKANAPLYQMEGPEEALPRKVDYQGTGADTVVKDQDVCGSCWAFGASGAMTGALFKSTGQHFSFSEQQIVDCGWNEGSVACDGGYAEWAMDYVRKNGIVLEEEYPYMGNDQFCGAHDTRAYFKGYGSIPARNISAVKEALIKKGPLAVAIDASLMSFVLYKSGVYTSESCYTDVDDLDHVVTLVGYGREKGKNYWKIRNSWSPFWGEDGYGKIDMEHDCGVTTDAIYAIVDEDKFGA